MRLSTEKKLFDNSHASTVVEASDISLKKAINLKTAVERGKITQLIDIVNFYSTAEQLKCSPSGLTMSVKNYLYKQDFIPFRLFELPNLGSITPD
jgi:hypothetical protein